MKIKNIFLAIFISASCLAAVGSVTAQESVVAARRVNSKVVHVTGASDVLFSRSGKHLIIKGDWKFYILPTADLSESVLKLDKARSMDDAAAIGFTPSDKVVFAKSDGLFALDPDTFKSRPIALATEKDKELETPFLPNPVLILSDENVISGDGDFDSGLEKGNVLRFDVRRGGMTRGARIHGFDYPQLSPDGKYVLYEHSNYDENHADVYEVSRDISHPLVARFGLKRAFPKYKYTDQFPIAWVSASRFLAVVQNNEFKEETFVYAPVDEGSPWLVLFDAVTGEIVWKAQIKDNFSPSEFQQLSPIKALAQIDKKVYEISLTDGKLSERPIFKFTAFAASPDKKTTAFFDFHKLFVSAIDGENRKAIFDLPEDWKHETDYKGFGVRPPLWSPDGETIIIFGEKQLYFVRQ